MSLDTGICAPESLDTLLIQQRQLMMGKRLAQMFPVGTPELGVPEGFARHENFRGVFHFNPNKLDPRAIDLLSVDGDENVILNLGPYSKYDIAQRVKAGEKVTCVTEFLHGIEVRCAAASTGTAKRQRQFFEQTKEPGSVVLIGVYPDRVVTRLNKGI